jgi:hypothetical protein
MALGCGGSGGTASNKPAGMGGGSGGPPAPEAGTPGTRGGGGGPFGGGNDPDGGGSLPGDAGVIASDGPTAGGLDAGRDLGTDRPRDSSFTPIDAISLADSATPGPDLGSPDPCNGATCEMLEADFRAALTRARVCNPMLKGQCLMTSATGLRCSGCKVWVSSNVELNAIRTMWNDAGCQACPKMCPAIACRAITTGTCYSKMLAYQEDPDQARIIIPPMSTGTCVDQSDPVPF